MSKHLPFVVTIGLHLLITGIPAASAGCAATADACASGLQLAYACDGRHLCKQMRSCEEARFFLNQCGVSSLDRDNDGVPCESICR